MSAKQIHQEMARPLGVKGHQKRSYLVAANKAKGPIFVESQNEHTTLLALDLDPRTRSIKSQPITVRLDLKMEFKSRSEAMQAQPKPPLLQLDGQSLTERVYTPDFIVELSDPLALIVESKSQQEIDKIKDKLTVRGNILRDLGYRYLVVSSADLSRPGLHANLSLLRDAIKHQSANAIQQKLNTLENALQGMCGVFLYADIKENCDDLSLYLALINGLLACDLKAGRLGARTTLWPAYGDLSHLKILNLDC